MQIHQVVVAASPGDAVTNSALALRRLLRRVGPSEIFARYIHPEVADEVHPLDRHGRDRGGQTAGDLLLFHMSIGDPEVFAFITERPERLVLIYHNITPAESFLPYDPEFAGLLERGRQELAALRDRVVLTLADSQFNARELVALGYRDVRVAPLIVDASELRRQDDDPELTHELANVDGPMFLYVGRLQPHKHPEFLLKAFHLLSTSILPEVNLALVGVSGTPIFDRSLRTFCKELNLLRARITDRVTQAELVSYYRRADAFVTASAHEGFCIPVLEAMSFDVPVVARACAAIPETVGNAGLLLPADATPGLFAEAMAAIVSDDALRSTLVARGRDRLDAFDPDRARAAYLEHLLMVA